MQWVPQFITSAASANLFELASLSVIWLLWLVGCVVSTVSTPIVLRVSLVTGADDIGLLRRASCHLLQSIWPNLSFCFQFAPCRILTAMMAFAWLGWVALVGLIVIAVLTAVKKARPSRAPLMVEWAARPGYYPRPSGGGGSGRPSANRYMVPV